jgi:hypothetical protein
MAMRDVFSGQPGEWRGGMWFPDNENPPFKIEDAAVMARVWSEHSRGAGQERIDRISMEFEKQCEEHYMRHQQRKLEEAERRAWVVVCLIIGFFVGLWVAHFVWSI